MGVLILILVSSYVVASMLFLGLCGAVSLGGMVSMEFHLSLVSLGGLWFCGSGVGAFFFIWFSRYP